MGAPEAGAAGAAIHIAGRPETHRGASLQVRLVARRPFGGRKLSGIGGKAGGPDYLLRLMQSRCVTENTLRRGVAPW